MAHLEGIQEVEDQYAAATAGLATLERNNILLNRSLPLIRTELGMQMRDAYNGYLNAKKSYDDVIWGLVAHTLHWNSLVDEIDSIGEQNQRRISMQNELLRTVQRVM